MNSLGRGPGIGLNKLKSPSFKRCQVWLELVHWFKKRRCKSWRHQLHQRCHQLQNMIRKTKAHLTLAYVHVPDHVCSCMLTLIYFVWIYRVVCTKRAVMYLIMYVNFDLFSVDIVLTKRAVWYSVIVEEGVRKVLHVVAQTLNSGTTPNIASIYQPKMDNEFWRHL